MVVDRENGNLFTRQTIQSWVALALAVFAIIAWGLRLEFKSEDHDTRIADLKARIDIIDTSGTRALAAVVLQTSQVAAHFDKIEAHLDRIDLLSSQVQRIEDRQGKVVDTLNRSAEVLNNITELLHGRVHGGEPRGP